jgi:hypothetical protein
MDRTAAAIDSRHRRAMGRGADEMKAAIRELHAAGPGFHEALYERATALIRDYAFSDLVGGDMLFELACRHKLTQRPQVPLTPAEIAGGLNGALYATDRAGDLLHVLEKVLPDLESMAPKWEALEESVWGRYVDLLDVVVRAARALLGTTDWGSRRRLASVLERWLTGAPGWLLDDPATDLSRSLRGEGEEKKGRG